MLNVCYLPNFVLDSIQNNTLLLNQAHASLWPACTWFLKIDPVQIIGMHVRVCAFVCPSLRLLITSGVMWHDMNLIRLVKQVLQLLYGVNGRGLGIDTHCENQPNKNLASAV